MMNTDSLELRHRLERYTPDEPNDFPFSARLARENGWSRSYALRVIVEYKRFAFLAVAAGHPVTPSDEVDQAWHLHLLYTRSYWNGFCGEVLRTPLHHEPTKGGRDEDGKFHDWYQRTLDSYRSWFEQEPPSDIWPPAEHRFSRDLRFMRINTARHWIVPKGCGARGLRRLRVFLGPLAGLGRGRRWSAAVALAIGGSGC